MDQVDELVHHDVVDDRKRSHHQPPREAQVTLGSARPPLLACRGDLDPAEGEPVSRGIMAGAFGACRGSPAADTTQEDRLRPWYWRPRQVEPAIETSERDWLSAISSRYGSPRSRILRPADVLLGREVAGRGPRMSCLVTIDFSLGRTNLSMARPGAAARRTTSRPSSSTMMTRDLAPCGDEFVDRDHRTTLRPLA